MKFIPPKASISMKSFAVCVAFFTGTPNADAILMPSLANYELHKALSNNPTHQFAAFIEVTTPSGNKVQSSGVAIAPNIILVAAHGIPSPTAQSVVTTVSMGPNIFGLDAKSYKIRSWERYPSYIFGNYNTLDFGLVYLDEYISGFTPVEFAPATVGQVLTFVGFGSFAGMGASSSQPSLGDRLAGYALVYNFVGSSFPAHLHLHTNLSINTPSSSLNIMGLPGDSGGPYFDEQGKIVGIHVGQTNGFDSGSGSALRTNNPDFLNYVNPRIAASWAEFYAQTQPELRNVFVQAPAVDQPPKFSGTVANGPPLGTARLQASLDLGTSDPWADVASVTLDAVGFATFTNIPDSRPQALGAPSDYFRVVTESPSSP